MDKTYSLNERSKKYTTEKSSSGMHSCHIFYNDQQVSFATSTEKQLLL